MTYRNAILSLALTTSLYAQERFRPGNWEIVFTGDNPHTSTTCFTSAMIEGINGTADAVRADTEKTAAKRKYKVENYKFDGTTLSYTAVGADRTFLNTASYHGDTFESVIITKAGGKEFTTRQKGRRIGNCP
jgi:Protein of unknown function (DUF3617)